MKERQSEREKQRIEQASRRNARSERRRAEGMTAPTPAKASILTKGIDSPPPTPSLSPSKMGSHSGQHSSKPNGINSPTPRPTSSNHKKTGRPPTKRGRLGRNQYTRDLPLHVDNASLRDSSRDRQGSQGSPPNGVNGTHTENGRPSRPRQHPTRTSMNEMKRRVAAILEFINRVQPEPPNSSSSKPGAPNGITQKGSVPASVQGTIDEISSYQDTNNDSSERVKDFGNMNSKEMMLHLGKDLRGWQSIHGKYGEK